MVATLVAGEVHASPWALRRMQPETVPVVPPAPELPGAAAEQDESGAVAQPPGQPAAPATVPGGPGSTDAPGRPPGWTPRPVIHDPEPGTGIGLLAGGIVVTVVGAALIGGGAAVIATHDPAFDSDSFDEGVNNGLSRVGGVLLIIVGIAPAISGIVMTSIGASKVSQHRAWQERQVTPRVGRTRHGVWTLGVQLSF